MASKDLQLNLQSQSSKDKNHAQNTRVFYTGTVNMSAFNVNHMTDQMWLLHFKYTNTGKQLNPLSNLSRTF